MATIEKLFDLTGRRALVTGATRGIGFAIAQAFLAHGAAVAISGRKPDTLQAAVEQLRTGGVVEIFRRQMLGMWRQSADHVERKARRLIIDAISFGQSGGVHIHDTLLNALSRAPLIMV